MSHPIQVHVAPTSKSGVHVPTAKTNTSLYPRWTQPLSLACRCLPFYTLLRRSANQKTHFERFFNAFSPRSVAASTRLSSRAKEVQNVPYRGRWSLTIHLHSAGPSRVARNPVSSHSLDYLPLNTHVTIYLIDYKPHVSCLVPSIPHIRYNCSSWANSSGMHATSNIHR